jgi:hypothetical protein
MNFEIGKQYIVSVSENGIVPIEEFSNERYFDIEYDSIDFLTDEEKVVIINDVLDKIKNEFIDRYPRNYANGLELGGRSCVFSLNDVLRIIDKYKVEREGETEE